MGGLAYLVILDPFFPSSVFQGDFNNLKPFINFPPISPDSLQDDIILLFSSVKIVFILVSAIRPIALT